MYQKALAAFLRASEKEERLKEVEEEEATYHARMTDALELATTDDCVVPPQAPWSPAKAEPRPLAL